MILCRQMWGEGVQACRNPLAVLNLQYIRDRKDQYESLFYLSSQTRLQNPAKMDHIKAIESVFQMLVIKGKIESKYKGVLLTVLKLQ